MEAVGGRVAGDRVGERVALAVDRRETRQGQVLDIGAEHVGDARHHRVDARARSLDHHVAGVVDDIGVVPALALHGVGADQTVEDVVAGIADQDVAGAVAGGVEARRAGERQVLDLVGQSEGNAGDHRVDAAEAGILLLDHRVADVVDVIGVVAVAALHRVGARSAVEDVVAAQTLELVVAGVADDRVGERVAGAAHGGAGQRQVLDVGRQRVVEARDHRVGAPAGRLDHHVAGMVDRVGVVAGEARKGVGARRAVEDVVAGRARLGEVRDRDRAGIHARDDVARRDRARRPAVVVGRLFADAVARVDRAGRADRVVEDLCAGRVDRGLGDGVVEAQPDVDLVIGVVGLLRVVRQDAVLDRRVDRPFDAHALAQVVVDRGAVDGDGVGELDQHALLGVVVVFAALDQDVPDMRRLAAALQRDVAALDGEACRAVAARLVVLQDEVPRHVLEVEAVAVVVVGEVVRIGPPEHRVGDEAVEPVVVRDGVPDHHVGGDLVRVDAVGRAVPRLDGVEGDVGLGLAAVLLDAADEAGLVAGVVGAVAVDRQVRDQDVVDRFEGGAHDAVDARVEVVGELDHRLADAGARQGHVGIELDRPARGVGGIAANDIGAGRHLDRAAARRLAGVDGALDRRRVVGHAVADRAEGPHIKRRHSQLSEVDLRACAVDRQASRASPVAATARPNVNRDQGKAPDRRLNDRARLNRRRTARRKAATSARHGRRPPLRLHAMLKPL